jgi:pimeloyl-ACP methyl ester carboxylesterase
MRPARRSPYGSLRRRSIEGLLPVGSRWARYVIGSRSYYGEMEERDGSAPALSDLDHWLGNGFTSAIAEVAGLRHHYVRGGTGPTVVLIHGFPQDWLEWRTVMPQLASSHDVLAVDLRGVGQSQPSASGYDAATLAGDVHGLLRELGIDSAHVVGHDVGGWVAYAFARRFPEATDSLVIIETLIPGIEPFADPDIDVPLWHGEFHMIPGLPEVLVSGRQTSYFRYFFEVGTERSDSVTDEEIAHYAWAYRDPGHLSPAFETYRALPANIAFTAEHTAAFESPVLLIGGELVFGPPLERTATTLRQDFGCRDIRAVTIPGARHYLPEDRPEEIADLILQHIGR